MAVVPKRRTSKTRKLKRRTHFKLELPSMMVCPNCGEVKKGHSICSNCGFYDGKLVKEPKVKEGEEAAVVESKASEKARVRAEKAKAKAQKKESKKESK